MQKILLHGGPWHGRIVAVQDGRDHIHIVEPVGRLADLFDDDSTQPTTVETHEGTYSVVRYSPTDFEWDGWISHD